MADEVTGGLGAAHEQDAVGSLPELRFPGIESPQSLPDGFHGVAGDEARNAESRISPSSQAGGYT